MCTVSNSDDITDFLWVQGIAKPMLLLSNWVQRHLLLATASGAVARNMWCLPGMLWIYQLRFCCLCYVWYFFRWTYTAASSMGQQCAAWWTLEKRSRAQELFPQIIKFAVLLQSVAGAGLGTRPCLSAPQAAAFIARCG